MSGVSVSGPKSRGGRRGAKRSRRRRSNTFALQLTSLMDVLMIVVVFLLKSYGMSSMGIAQSDKLELPVSRAPETFGEGLALVIAQDKIILDAQEILLFKGDPKEKKFELPEGSLDTSSTDRGILPLYEALKKKKDDFDLLASRSSNPKDALAKWSGDVLVQADKTVPYELIRRVMYTAGMAGYKSFRLTVEKQEE